MIAIAFRAFFLKAALAPVPSKLTPDDMLLAGGVLPLASIAVALISHWYFTATSARLAATFLGAAAVLYGLAIPELWAIANILGQECARHNEIAGGVPAICYDWIAGLAKSYAFFLSVWSVTIVLPIVAGVTLVHGWLLLLAAVLRGVRAKLRRLPTT